MLFNATILYSVVSYYGRLLFYRLLGLVQFKKLIDLFVGFLISLLESL